MPAGCDTLNTVIFDLNHPTGWCVEIGIRLVSVLRSQLTQLNCLFLAKHV
jgi:hypothetical protein